MNDRQDPPFTYPPLNRLKPVCENLWIVDGPIIRFGMPWPKLPFPTRMTIVRSGKRDLFIHSPTPPTQELRREIEAIGEPRWIVAPNRIHHAWIGEWMKAFPQSEAYLAPGIEAQRGKPVDFPFHRLDRDGGCPQGGWPWDSWMDTLPIESRYMTEVIFFHRPTATLIVADLIENFEPKRLRNPVMRLLTRLGGVRDPHGSMPRDMRLTFAGRRAQLRAAIDKMIAWNPERIILAHGRWYDHDGAAELRRAFRWLDE
ncbi:DUF4336 domain-containing protein [Sphingosinicella rhizophila]|uniref:DUF4336 domain-containing protein n=1 Tax=Sphingosinicella rhizophila TaxID=3050082 RepID=A0ABU3QA86_9SPHN|nr:DUF4336 domain-containing protein [Sphingosinicella sp. GR2756]MDT9600271.1 DUF4336 domain-containing protein [Sphingosinicella sp. GR2756]